MAPVSSKLLRPKKRNSKLHNSLILNWLYAGQIFVESAFLDSRAVLT